MAFEAYLQQDRLRPRRGRRMTYTVSVIAHGVAVMGAIAYSFWHVEELKPPSTTVTFISAASAPPPPPPPPPLGGGAQAAKHRPVVRPHVDVTPKVTEIVQPKVEPEKDPPKETPKEVGKEDEKPAHTDPGPGDGTAGGVKGGVAGGVKGGVVGGTVGGTGTAAAPRPKFLPPQMGQQQKISGREPDFPSRLSTPGANYVVRAQVCVKASGEVESVTLIKRAHPDLDNNVLTALKGWRYRPLMANGTPIPFCTFVVHEFKAE